MFQPFTFESFTAPSSWRRSLSVLIMAMIVHNNLFDYVFILTHNHFFVKVTTCPIAVFKNPFTLLDQSQIKTNIFSRSTPGCWFVNFTSFLINEGMNSTTTAGISLNDFKILTTFFNGELVVITIPNLFNPLLTNFY